MKKIFLFFTAIIFSFNTFSQVPSWVWANSAGGTNHNFGVDIALDANGNVYAVGYFESSPISFGTITLTSAGGFDIFVVKYNSGGNVLWAKRIGGVIDDYGLSIATDAGGNVYVTGSYGSSSITIGPFVLTNTGNG